MDAAFPSADWVSQEYSRLRQQGLSVRRSWEEVKALFLSKYTNTKPKGDAHQAWKSHSGAAFEQIVLSEMKNQVASHSMAHVLALYKWSELGQGDRWDILRQMLSDILWLRGTIREPYSVESQVDLVALEMQEDRPERIIAVYSVKVSLRERFQQDLYWVDKFRSRGIPFCFITLDNDGVLRRALTEGHLHSKQAQMAAALYDRTYIFEDDITDAKGLPFRPISDFYIDLKLWWERR